MFDLGYAAFARIDYVFQGIEGLLIETTPFRRRIEIIYMPSVVVPLVGKQISREAKPAITQQRPKQAEFCLIADVANVFSCTACPR